MRHLGGSGDDWRVHTASDLLAAHLAEVTVTAKHTGEELSWMSRLREGDIVVADNGYGSRSSVAVVREQGAHLVTFVTPSTFPVQTRAARAHRGAGLVAADDNGDRQPLLLVGSASRLAIRCA